MLRTLLARLFPSKTTPAFNPELAYCQAQRFLQYQVRQAQQAQQAQVPPRPAPTTRPKAPKAVLELVAGLLTERWPRPAQLWQAMGNERS